MNVNTAIKNIKTELSTVKEENKKFKNTDVDRQIKSVVTGIKDLERYREYMLEMSDAGGYDHRFSMMTGVKFCYDCLSSANFYFYMSCGAIYIDNDEYANAKAHYEQEEDRLKNINI